MITTYDTSIGTENLGDYIIMDSVSRVLDEIFPQHQRIALPTHDTIGKHGRSVLKRSSLAIVGGTNILTSHAFKYRQWKISLLDTLIPQNTVLLGVGWWQYQDRPDWRTRCLYNRVLSRKFKHSVRDAYTKLMLESCGFRNTINTGCPTTWGLTEEACRRIPTTKAAAVVCTLTDYKPNARRDSEMIATLKEAYGRVLLWPQGSGDRIYASSLALSGIELLSPNLSAFDEVLQSGDVDYVGTRLHAGIRAMQKGVRSIIIAVDNRAAEKKKDLGLPVLLDNEFHKLRETIKSQWETNVNIPSAAIADWKQQFADF